MCTSERPLNRLISRGLRFGQAPTLTGVRLEAVKMACCALAEDYQTIDSARMLANRSLSSASGDGGELQSQTVGSWSKTYRSGGSSAKDALNAAESAQGALMETAKMYLAGTGLLKAKGYYA